MKYLISILFILFPLLSFIKIIQKEIIPDKVKEEFPAYVDSKVDKTNLIRNLNFEKGLDGWEATGTAFNNQPTYGHSVKAYRVIGNGTEIIMPLGGQYWQNTSYPIGHQGAYWIGTYENCPQRDMMNNPQGDGPIGTLSSLPFVVEKNFISFLIGGGNNKDQLKFELLIYSGQRGTRSSVKYNDGYYIPTGNSATGMNNELFRREWWDVRSLKGKICRLRIVDNASGSWGHINIDAIQLINKAPNSTRNPTVFRSGSIWKDKNSPIWGITDMHTHPMSHLAFGKKALHGAPDIGMIVPWGAMDCNPADFRATSMAQALSNCYGTHGGWDAFKIPCGNSIRFMLVNDHLDKDFRPHQYEGYPKLTYWPNQSSILHQQMWIDWIKRAYQGGLRTMVALTVNNTLLSEILDGEEPKSDKNSSDLQVEEIKRLVNRHNGSEGSIDDWMEIAYSSADVRRIVHSNKLAIILGVEVDNLGDFNLMIKSTMDEVTKRQIIKSELDRLFNNGVRYIFPIHLIDNPLGGSAVYEVMFNFANFYTNKKFYDIKSDKSIGVDINLVDQNLLNVLTKFMSLPPLKLIPPGHVNKRGLTPLGKYALEEMMRLGMLIDIDHMSQESVNQSLDLAEKFKYPLNSGHNSLRPDNLEEVDKEDWGEVSERSFTDRQHDRIARLNGVSGIGAPGKNASYLIKAYLEVKNSRMHDDPNKLDPSSGYLALGTDVNGFEKLPLASSGLDKNKNFYNGFQQCSRPDGPPWDYRKDNTAHYGLLPDFLQDVSLQNNGGEVLNGLFLSSEYFARMWEICEQRARSIQ